MFLAYMYTGVELIYVSECEKKNSYLQEPEQQPARRRRRVEENEEQADQLPGPASPPYPGIDDLRWLDRIFESRYRSTLSD